MEVSNVQESDKGKATEPGRMLTVYRCEIVLSRVRMVGEPEEIALHEAMDRFAPSKERRAKMNVVNVRSGWYIGLQEQGDGVPPSNFIFRNPAKGGDIRWITEQNPEFENTVLELYYVKDVVIPSGIEGDLLVQKGRPRA